MAKDKELEDHERAHTGKPGSKVRHGADATGRAFRMNTLMNRLTPDEKSFADEQAEKYRFGVDKKGRELRTDVKGWPPGTKNWRDDD